MDFAQYGLSETDRTEVQRSRRDPSFMNKPSPFRSSLTGFRIGLSISAAFAVPAALSVLQVYIRSRVLQQGIKWQDLVSAGSEWLFVGLFTPLIYQIGRRFSVSRTRLRVWLMELGPVALEGPQAAKARAAAASVSPPMPACSTPRWRARAPASSSSIRSLRFWSPASATAGRWGRRHGC